jgi:hypothetical protein
MLEAEVGETEVATLGTDMVHLEKKELTNDKKKIS